MWVRQNQGWLFVFFLVSGCIQSLMTVTLVTALILFAVTEMLNASHAICASCLKFAFFNWAGGMEGTLFFFPL